ncbi:carbon-monoxide dehydrogenase medium subunit [Rhizobiales bacterium GAS191]|nr:carbon-monoxide dehydrogenase medium subunit [Rhizobiales bacterium GAS191]
MKPTAFDYARPRTLDEAVRLLSDVPGAKLLAGGQTLGPMLNLRLVQPSLVIDITRIPELARIEDEGDAVILGACVTHAAIEDGRITDPSNGFLARVAHGIAYRAVRTRGTIGGSLAHADPAADWLSCLTALGAEILVTGSKGRRRLPLGNFVRGAMATDMAHDEILDGVRIPKFSKGARAGFAKICRKAGDFAEAIGVAVHDAERGVLHLVAGATQGRPILIDAPRTGLADTWPPKLDGGVLRHSLRQAGLAGDGYELNIHAAAVRRAIAEAVAS